MVCTTARVSASLLLASWLLTAPAAHAGDGDAGGLAERIAGHEIAAAHPPLDDPPVRAAADADHMRPDDVVAGVTVGERARAYPWWILKNHHAVNDRVGELDVLVAFCEQCSAATAFRRDLDDRVLRFETEGVVNGTIVLRDRRTGTLWAPFDGRGLEGPLAGRALARLPVFLTTWADWRARHPETDVVHAPQTLRAGHGARETPGKWGIVGVMGETLRTWDTRLAENDFVFGVREGEAARAYPLRTVRARGGAVNDQLAGRPVAVLARGAHEMAGYDRRHDGATLTFEPAAGEGGRFRDRETGSIWTIEGAAVAGRLAGARLTPVDGYLVEWHVWSEYHPGTEIFAATSYRPPTGFELPLRALPRLTGERVAVEPLSLDAERNLVLVWARWCPPCRDKLPLMRRLAAAQTERGYRFATIAVQLAELAELGELQAFLYQHDISWPVYLFDDERYAELDRRYREAGGRGLVIPTLFVTDRSGVVLHVLEGPDLDDDAVDRVIAR